MENVSLEKMTFYFSQDSHCMSEKDGEFLEIECLSDIGIDGGNGFYMVLKTEQWAIDSIDDLKELVKRIEKTMLKKKPIKK